MSEDPQITVIEGGHNEVHSIDARTSNGLDYANVYIRWDRRTGPAKALLFLARVGVEVIVRARKSKPVQVLAREARDG